MKEILIFNENDYPNFLDNITESYSEIIEILNENKYVQPKRYDQNIASKEEFDIEVTFDKSLPLFSRCMTNFILEHKTFPTQNLFQMAYINNNMDFFKENGLVSSKYFEAIRNRCDRAYPSLVRDLVFGKFLQSRLPKGYKVISNEDLDTKAEIDLLIVGSKRNIGIHLYVDTKRSREFRNQKNYRQRIDFENVTHVDLPIDLSNCDTINNLKLYGEKQYKELIDIVKNI